MQLPRGVLLFLGAVAVLLPRVLVGVTPHDEGFVATGAMLVLRGELPYRDFLSFYGPAVYYALASLFLVLGEDLFVLRVFHVFVLAGLAIVLERICRVRLLLSPTVSAVVGATAVAISLFAITPPGYAAVPAALLLLLVPLVTDFSSVRRGVVAAAALIAAAGLFRWDFGAFGLAALLGTIAWRWRVRAIDRTAAVGLAVRAAATAGVIMAAVYIPLIFVASDPTRWLHEVLFYQLFEFPKWRGVSFVVPSIERFLHASARGDVYAIYDSLLRVLYLPLPILAAAAAGFFLWKQSAEDTVASASGRSACVAYLTLLTLLLLNQMRVRPSTVQGFPAVTASLPLLALGVRRLWGRRPRMRAPLVVLGFTVGSALFTTALRNGMRPLRTFAPSPATRATMISIDADDYAAMIAYVREHSAADEPIYSGTYDHSKLFIADSLVYFLADREPADRYMELEPGIANTQEGQTKIRDDLESARPPVVVLSDLSTKEPNLTATSNGVHLLDDYIAAKYREGRRFGNYRVMLRNPDQQRT